MNFRLGGSKRKGLDDEDSIVRELLGQGSGLISFDNIPEIEVPEPMGRVFYLDFPVKNDFPDNNDLNKYMIWTSDLVDQKRMASISQATAAL